MLDDDLIMACITDTRLRLILMPTEACNFRCVYCYEDFALARMKPKVVRGVKKLISAHFGELEQLHLSWFGGEPLLALDIVEDVMKHVRKRRRERPSVRLKADMTTNAYRLDQATLRHLLKLGVSRYQVTFDGPQQWHDVRRVRAGGGPTFEKIWNNLLDASAVDGAFRIVVRLHADERNLEALPEFIRHYDDAFGHDPRFRLFMRRVSRLGGAGDARLPILNATRGRSVLRQLKAIAAERGVAAEIEGEHDHVCYAATANSFVIRADGRLNKCTVALEHPRNQVGRLKKSGKMTLRAKKMPVWRRGFFSGDLDELICPLIGIPGAFEAPARSARDCEVQS